MIHYVKLDASGALPEKAGCGLSAPSGFVALPDGMVFRDVWAKMLVDGGWVPRPSLPEPVSDGDTTTMTGAPISTSCEVVDTEIGAILATVTETAGVIVIELPDAGRYTLDFLPPLPFLPLSLTVVTL